MTPSESRPNRKWLPLGAAVGLLVVAFLGMQTSSGLTDGSLRATTAERSVDPTFGRAAISVCAEDSLRAPLPEPVAHGERLAAKEAGEDIEPAPEPGGPWRMTCRLVDTSRRVIAMEELQLAGFGLQSLQLRYTDDDGKSPEGVLVPEPNSSFSLKPTTMLGRGGLPVTFALSHGRTMIARGVGSEDGEVVDLEIDVEGLKRALRQVEFRATSQLLSHMQVRGAGGAGTFGAAEPLRLPNLDDEGALATGVHQITVGLLEGRYSYEAFLYDPIAKEPVNAAGSVNVGTDDMVVELEGASLGSLEGHVVGFELADGGQAAVQLLGQGENGTSNYHSIQASKDGGFSFDDLAAQKYRLVAYTIYPSTLTASFLGMLDIDVAPNEAARRDLDVSAQWALRRWKLVSEHPAFAIRVIHLAPDGACRVLMDLPTGGSGVYLELPREFNLEFRAAPIIEHGQSTGPDFSRWTQGEVRGGDEVWFSFD